MSVVGVGVLLPLALLRNLAFLRYTSTLALIFMVYGAGLCLYGSALSYDVDKSDFTLCTRDERLL